MSARPLRVLHLLNSVRESGNGIINTAMDLAWGQARLGHQVQVASAGGDFEPRLADWGVRHHRIDQRRTPGALWAARSALAALLRSEAFDVVHAHMLTGVVLARLARAPRARGGPLLIGHVHNVYQRSVRLTALADVVLCCGTSVRATMRALGVPDRQLAVVLNGTVGSPRLPALESVVAAPLQRPAIVTVAGMNARKGIDELLAAFALIAARHPSAHLHLVGDGPERARFETRAREGGVGARIHFHGFQRDPQPFLKAADLFVLASRRESFPIVLGEARAAGCAIIATAVDGVPEALDDGRSGRLVPPRDAAALAAALDAMLSDEALRAEQSAAALHGLARFRVERMVEETVQRYRSFLA